MAPTGRLPCNREEEVMRSALALIVVAAILVLAAAILNAIWWF